MNQPPRDNPRKRLQRSLLKAIAVLLIVTVLFTASLTYALKAARFTEFSHECRGIRKGVTLEEIRTSALQRDFVMEPDPTRYSSAREDFFILRPNRDWPVRFSCHFAAERGMITQTY